MGGFRPRAKEASIVRATSNQGEELTGAKEGVYDLKKGGGKNERW